MESASTDSCAAEEDESPDSEVSCLMRIGRNSEWLLLQENTEITVGRGVDVTYQLLSPSCPLMISRLHCTFKQSEDGQWTVTDKKSLNGVWLNGNRLPPDETRLLRLGDTVQLGVPVIETKVEFEYTLVRRPLKDIRRYLANGHREGERPAHVPKKLKRKLASEEVQPSTSKPKLYRCSSADKSCGKPCPLSPAKDQLRMSRTQPEETMRSGDVQEAERPSSGSHAPCDQDNLQMYSQNILMMRQQVDDTLRQVATMANPLRSPLQELQGQLQIFRAKMQQMEALERSFGETKEKKKTHQQEELMKKQLEEALQEQKKVIDELAFSRQAFEAVLSAKNKELEVTKEEKEKARAQKEEVVTQVTEVLENELQCIICSELFIEAVILNCAHSFCCYCIQQWRKKKDECPICRQAIQSQTRCLALDNCIDRMVENLSLDMKTRRQELITERKGDQVDDPEIQPSGADVGEVMLIHDDDSTSSTTTTSDSSSSSSTSSSGSGSGGSSSEMVSIYSSLSSVVSVDTESSINMDFDESFDESED